MNNSPILNAFAPQAPQAPRETANTDASPDTGDASGKRTAFEAALDDANRAPLRRPVVAGPIDSTTPTVSRDVHGSEKTTASRATNKATHDASDDDADEEKDDAAAIDRLGTNVVPVTTTPTRRGSVDTDGLERRGEANDATRGIGGSRTSTPTTTSTSTSTSTPTSSSTPTSRQTGDAEVSDAIMARLTKVRPGETLPSGLSQHQDSRASKSQQIADTSHGSSNAGGPNASSHVPSEVMGAIADLARRVGAKISWQSIPLGGSASPTSDSKALPGAASSGGKNSNAASQSKDAESAASQTSGDAVSANENASKEGTSRASSDGGSDAGTQPDDATNANAAATSSTHSASDAARQSITNRDPTSASDGDTGTAHPLAAAPTDGSSPPGKARDGSKTRESSQKQIDTTGALRTSVEPLRAGQVGSSSASAQAESAKNLASNRTAERQSDAEIAVSRMTLRNGIRAETVVADLGRVSIEAKAHADNIDLHVVADRADTAALLETHRPELRADLARSRVPVAELSIGVGSQSAGSQSGSQSHGSQNNGSHGSSSNQSSQHRNGRDHSGESTSGPALDNLTSSSLPHRGRRVRIVL